MKNVKARLEAKESETPVIDDQPFIALIEPTSKKLYNFLSKLRFDRFGPPSIG